MAGSLPVVCSGLQTAESGNGQGSVREGGRMYQPALRPDQITQLYYLKLQRKKPMARLLREAVDHYLQTHAGELDLEVKELEATFPKRKR
jgi:hypothetical protein